MASQTSTLPHRLVLIEKLGQSHRLSVVSSERKLLAQFESVTNDDFCPELFHYLFTDDFKPETPVVQHQEPEPASLDFPDSYPSV